MKTQPIGLSSLISTRLSYGCMRIAGTWDPAAITPEMAAVGRAAVVAAYEAGFTLFDHADIYGRGGCETIFGQVLQQIPEMRQRILIATKCGVRFPAEPNPDSPHRYDFSADHILWSCEQSLKRLNVETIDLYQLHRPDVLMNPIEVAEAFDKLRAAGKARYFGVSNFSPSQVSTLQRDCSAPLIVNQVEIHLGRLECFFDGTLDQCISQRMTPLSWSPLGGGSLGAGGKFHENHPRREPLTKLLGVLDQTAEAHGVSRTVISLAWLLKHPSKMIPIIGSLKPENIRDAAKADGVDLSREEWYRILIAARGHALP